MSKDLANRNSSSQGKSLYNLADTGSLDSASLSTVLGFLNSGSSVTTDQFGAVAQDGDKVFGVLSADTMTGNITTVIQKLTIGNGGLLQIIPSDQKKVNDVLTYGVLITTDQLVSTNTNIGYTSITLNVPYKFSIPDYVPNADNREAPDNALMITNTKFRVSGPFTFIKSVKTAFTNPILTLGYYDRVDAATIGSTELTYKQYDKGIVMERIEEDQGDIKFSYMGYSQKLGRFTFYNTGQYVGTDTYKYLKKDGKESDESGILTEYNIDRIAYDPSDVTQNINDVVTKVDIDSLYTNVISSADHTYTRKLNINAYDDMAIKVGVDSDEVSPPLRNYDFLLSSEGGISMTSTGLSGTKHHSVKKLVLESETATYINPGGTTTDASIDSKPVYIGKESKTVINNYLQSLNYLSTGISGIRNPITAVEFGGTFTAPGGGMGSQVLLDGTINSYGKDDAHGLYSNPKIVVPPNNLDLALSGTSFVSNITLSPIDLQIGEHSKVGRSSTLYIKGQTTNADENYAFYMEQGSVKWMGPNGSYLMWEGDTLSLFNSRIFVNPQPGNTKPYVEMGQPGRQTNIYTLVSLENVTGANELFVDAFSTHILLTDNSSFCIVCDVSALQHDGTSCHIKLNCHLTIINGIKTVKQTHNNNVHNNIDLNGENIFDFFVGFSGHSTNFAETDYLIFTGINTNGAGTKWIANTFVTILTV